MKTIVTRIRNNYIKHVKMQSIKEIIGNNRDTEKAFSENHKIFIVT